MDSERFLVIGCETVINELKMSLPAAKTRYQPIDAGLHLRPEKLKQYLQDAIDKVDGRVDAIILGFGLCSNAVVGLHARKSTLVVPRVDDCIAMLLGSQKRYRQELERTPGTYFLSRGWIDSGTTLMEDLNEMARRYGRERALGLMKKMLGHYTRLAYIHLGNGDQQHYREFSRKAAQEFGLDYHEIEGTPDLLQAMLSGRWNDDLFIVVKPGRIIRLEDFRSTERKEETS